MSIALALIAALGYGTADFLGGLASRRLDFRLVGAISQALGLVAVLIAVVIFPGDAGLTGRALLWGAVAGVGNALGVLALYYGLSVGRMSVVATLSGLTASVLPVLVGIAQGDSITVLSAVGVVIAIPAIALVSWQPAGEEEERSEAIGGAAGSGAVWGLVAGVGFAIFFISLDKAGSDSGAWPSAINQAMALLIVAPLALRVLVKERPVVVRSAVVLSVWTGIAVGLTTLCLLAAFSGGELAIVVVLTSLYPGVTTLLARFVLVEHWVRTQKIGLITALAAVVLVSAGSG